MHVICRRVSLQRAVHCLLRSPASAVASSGPLRSSRSRTVSEEAMAMVYPDPIRIPAKAAHTASVFMLHGLGDTGAGWADIAELWADGLPHVDFVFPTAPIRPVTLNGGMPMTAWHDIISLDAINSAEREDADGLLASAEHVRSLISAEEDTAGIPPHRIVVAGFSQGGAVALLMLRQSVRLAGIVGLSTYLTLRSRPPMLSPANASTPVFCAHGTADQVVSWNIGKDSYRILKEAGVKIEVEIVSGMGHEVWPPELSAIEAFISDCLPAEQP